MNQAERDKAEAAVREAEAELAKAIAVRVEAGNLAVVEELRDLATWVPEFTPRRCETRGTRLPAGEREEVRTAPFLSESYLYALLGKEDARTLLALVESVCRAVGISGGIDRLQEPMYRERERAEREIKERALRRLARTEEGLALRHTFVHQGGRACPACKAEGVLDKLPRGEKDRCRRWPSLDVAVGLARENLHALHRVALHSFKRSSCVACESPKSCKYWKEVEYYERVIAEGQKRKVTGDILKALREGRLR